jgi:hypothetical protein
MDIPVLRQYTIQNEDDSDNIVNERCPEYALFWQYEQNHTHWEPNHDYFLGNGKNITDNIELRTILSEKLSRGTLTNKIVFCDLDGVLADFEMGIMNKFKKPISEIKTGLMWAVIGKSKTFFETLPWMPRGRELWDNIKKYDPIILTGIPNNPQIAEQKRRWCARELGENIHVITCKSKDKHQYCITNSILIDDRTDNMNAWNQKGGIFMLYKEELLDEICSNI